jgi:hypothetical protein
VIFFYEIDIYDVNIPLFVYENINSIIESMIVKELCYKNIIDLNYGQNYFIARNKYKNSIVGAISIMQNWAKKRDRKQLN